MSHVRQQIREAAAAAIKAGSTGAGDDVYDSLVYPSDEDNLPLIHCHIEEEESDLGAMGAANLTIRVASLVITAVAQDDENKLDNTLDTLAAEIEALIGGNTFSGAAKSTVLVSTNISRSDSGRRPSGAISLTYQVQYLTAENDGETAL